MLSHPKNLIDRFAPNLVVVVVSLYLMFSPVWSPFVAPRMYDNSRVLEIAMLVILATVLWLPKMASATVTFWESLGGISRWLILIFLFGGTLSAIASGTTHIGVLQMGLMAQLALLFLLTGVAVRRAGKDGEIVLAIAITAGAGLLVLKFWIAFMQMYVEGRTFSWVSPFLDFANDRSSKTRPHRSRTDHPLQCPEIGRDEVNDGTP